MRYVEENEAAWSAEQLAAAEAQIEDQKREWELNRQAAIDAEEARLREEEATADDDEDDQLVYTREPTNEVKRRRGKYNSESSETSALSSSDTDTDSGSGSDIGDDDDDDGPSIEDIDLDDYDDDEIKPRVQFSSSVPSRKTRSRGRVDINLWRLDEESAALKANKRRSTHDGGKVCVNGKLRRDSSDIDVLNVDSNDGTPPVKTTRSGRRVKDNVGHPSPSLPPRLRST